MTGEELSGLIAARLGAGAVSDVSELSGASEVSEVSELSELSELSETGEFSNGSAGHVVTVTVDVPPRRWLEALAFARDGLGCDFFDWLSAVDELTDGFAIVVHVYALAGRHHLLVRTRIGRDAPHLPTATRIYRGAAWHERETAEMFGVVFDGHPDPSPLLLPDGFEGYPLRKDFVLAARLAKPWPGGKEPGDPAGSAPARRRLRPPGVSADWGDAAARAADPARIEGGAGREQGGAGGGQRGAGGEQGGAGGEQRGVGPEQGGTGGEQGGAGGEQRGVGPEQGGTGGEQGGAGRGERRPETGRRPRHTERSRPRTERSRRGAGPFHHGGGLCPMTAAPPPRSRGVIALLEENCTVCMLCARECPDWCIYIDSHTETARVPGSAASGAAASGAAASGAAASGAAGSGRPRARNVLDRFAIDFSLCMYCGICIEVCPFDALFWSPEAEYAEFDIRDLTHERDRLRGWLRSVPPPPPDDPAAPVPKEVAAAQRAAQRQSL